MNLKLKLRHALAALPLVALFSFATVARADEAPPDSWITTKAKVALLTASGVKANAVHVDTINGVVTLHGKVATTEQRSRAGEAALVPGATGVRNLLQVVPTDERPAVAAADGRIKGRVADLLKADKSLESSHIAVKSVDKGVVLLAGHAASDGELLEAIECVSNVAGVRRIASEVKLDKESPPMILRREPIDTRTKERSFSTSAKDSEITTAVKLRLIGTSGVPALDVNVDSSRGVVTLFGIVPSEEARAAAAAAAKKVDGVDAVSNELQVVPTSRRDLVDARDDDVQRAVKRELGKHPSLEKIDVETKNGVVRLSGTVDSPWRRLNAATLARSVAGVKAVEDDLKTR